MCRIDQFADFSEFTDQLRGSETAFVQLAVGHPQITHCCFDAGDVILHRTQFGLGSSGRSTRRPDWASLVIDLSPKRWCGIDVAAGAVRLIVPGREMHVASQGPWDTLSINIQRDTLARWAPVVADTLDADLAPDHYLLRSDQAAVNALTGWAQALLGARSADDADEWVGALRQRLKQHVLAVLGGELPTRKVSSLHRVARYDVVLAALERIHNSVPRRTTVTGLARDLGVGPRSIEYAFRTVIGVSPFQYILAERLNRARHDLRTGWRSAQTVTTIAFQHEFQNLSRFASQYARLFGERPSDTLHMAKNALGQA
ncbi:helix-turn-helix domain-containing protein [Vineibacter terrae]|uniref:AraC family transcriptional regulator n=1 Tax=Vineibacter terrae TaxID=2586908 RepID=UPI002E319ED7|nr:helix-turn-helix domain-containing protein [Vineibacter terrae]HEX2886055.1 helix-turn-helix domain-containing protein [Vineibacter terrae]